MGQKIIMFRYQFVCFKVVLEGHHRYFSGVKVKRIKLIAGRRFLAARSGLNGLDDLKAAIYACPNHTDDGIHSDHGYLDTCDNPHLKVFEREFGCRGALSIQTLPIGQHSFALLLVLKVAGQIDGIVTSVKHLNCSSEA